MRGTGLSPHHGNCGTQPDCVGCSSPTHEGAPHRPSMLVEIRFGDRTSKAQPTKSPSSSIFAKSLSRSFSVKVFESEKKVEEKVVLSVRAFPCLSPALPRIPRNPVCRHSAQAHLPLSGPPDLPGGTEGSNRWRRPWDLGREVRFLRAEFPPVST